MPTRALAPRNHAGQRPPTRTLGEESEIVNTYHGPIYDGIVGLERIDRDDIDVKFEEALRFIDAHWTQFDDPSGVAADIAELRIAVSGTRPVNPIRTRLTVHRLRRTAGAAAPIAAIIAVVREVLGTV